MTKWWLFAVLALSLALPAHASAVAVSSISIPHVTFVDASGNPCAGCKLFSYLANTATPTPTYTDSTGGSQNTNPIILDTAGGANIWTAALSYKFVLTTATGSTIWTVDNVPSINFLSGVTITGATIVNSTINSSVIGGTTPAAITGTAGTFATVVSGTMQGVYNANACSLAAPPSWCAGSDMGAWINAAYAAGPSSGVSIYIPGAASCYAYTTTIAFAIEGKPVTLIGAGDTATCLSYTPTTGTAMLLNTGFTNKTDLIQDMILVGSGVGNSTTGLTVGGTVDTGTEGAHIERVIITGFGLGAQNVQPNSFITVWDHVQLNNNQQNFSQTVGEENNRFINSTFSLDIPGTTGTAENSILLSNSAEDTFIGCSFDNVQLVLGTNATATVIGGHFENPGLTSYDYIVNGGNTLNLQGVFFLQDAMSFANDRFMSATAGFTSISGGEEFSPGTLSSFINVANAASVSISGFSSDSSLSAGFVNGTTTGSITQSPDTNGNITTNKTITAGSNVQASNNVTATHQVIGETLEISNFINLGVAGFLSINSNKILPASLTGFHGNASGIDVQFSDGTGTSAHPAIYDANGNLTDGPAGFSGSCGSATTLTVVDGIITGCS